MDENFLLHQKRALRLLELMRRARQVVGALRLQLGERAAPVHRWSNWSGSGSRGCGSASRARTSAYAKLNGTDTRALVRQLQAHGIRVLGSSIIGLDEHTPENIDRRDRLRRRHDTEFHQFMLYTPVPGTPLYAEHVAKGTLLPEEQCSDADTHGQLRFNFRHPHITDGEETEFLLRAFRRDFEVNGPSVTRIARTLLRGYLALKDHPDARVRERIRFETKGLATAYAAALWASERWFAGSNAALAARLRETRVGIGQAFGWKARLAARILGPVVLGTLWLEQRRLRAGRTYEPPTFYEANEAAIARPELASRGAMPCRFVTPPEAPTASEEVA